MNAGPPNAIQDSLRPLRGLLDETRGIEPLDALDFTEEFRLFDDLQVQMNRRVALAVVGEFNTGKSTFINAILGQDLLPAKYVPTTRQVMRIAHSEGPAQVAVADPAHASPPLPLSRDAILKLAGTGERLDIQTRIPAPWSDLILYDTPGVNDATAIAEDLIFDLMDQVDVVVFMMRADAALKESEARFVGQLVRHKDLDKFFFNVNFADLLDPGEGERVRTRVADTLGRLRKWPTQSLRDRVFLCSARHSFARGLADSASPGVDPTNDHDRLLWALHAYATTRKQDLLHAYAENLIRTVAQSAGEKLTAAIEAAGDRDAGYGKALVQINSEINGIRASNREEEIAFQSHVRVHKRAVITKVGEALEEIRLDFRDRIMASSEGRSATAIGCKGACGLRWRAGSLSCSRNSARMLKGHSPTWISVSCRRSTAPSVGSKESSAVSTSRPWWPARGWPPRAMRW